jgi:hypothetical protein
MVSFFSQDEEDAVLSRAAEMNIVRSVAAYSEGLGKQDYKYWIRHPF